MKVALFIPCFIDQFYPHVGASMVQVLERLGCEVDYPEGQTCCGQPAFNSGYWKEARAVAERSLDIFADSEVVVSASGSCGAMMRGLLSRPLQGDRPPFRRAPSSPRRSTSSPSSWSTSSG